MTKLFLGNIPHGSSESEVQQWIESQGFRVESVEIIYDRATGKPRGFGFASLDEQESVQKAVDVLNGKLMESRAITVNRATPLVSRAAHLADGKLRAF